LRSLFLGYGFMGRGVLLVVVVVNSSSLDEVAFWVVVWVVVAM
jgi:hypothetical protein